MSRTPMPHQVARWTRKALCTGIASAVLGLALAAAPDPTNAVDAAFPPYQLTTVFDFALQSDGGLLVNDADRGLVRLTATGELDPSFHPGPLILSRSGDSVVAIPTGGAYLLGNDGRAVRVDDGGSVDPSFAPVAGVQALVGVQGGKLLLITNGRLARYDGNGSPDPTFKWAPPAGPAKSVTRAVIEADGSLLVFAQSFSDSPAVGSGSATLTSANGEPTSSITFPDHLADAVPLPDGKWMVDLVTFSGDGHGGQWPVQTKVERLLADGTVDPTFTAYQTEGLSLPYNANARLTVLPEGRIIVAGDLPPSLPISPTQALRVDGFIRLSANGTLDPTFSARFITNPTQSWKIVPLGDGRHAIVLWAYRLYRVTWDAETPWPPQIVQLSPTAVSVAAGDSVTFTVEATGAGPLSLGRYPVASLTDAPAPSLTFDNVQLNTAPARIYAHGPTGSAWRDVAVTVLPAPPRVFTEPPATLIVAPGRSVALALDARGSEPITWTVRKDGATVPAGRLPLQLSNVTAADLGAYEIRAANAYGAVERTIRLAFGPHSELSNVSARAWTGPGAGTLTLGISVTGPKQLWATADGGSLRSYGISLALDDPTLTLFAPGNAPVFNDNTPVSAIFTYGRTGAWLPLVGSKAAVLTPDLQTRGAFQVGGSGGTDGVVLANIWDADDSMDRIRQFSARANVGRGERALIVGFVVLGDAPKRLLIRAVGPGLAPFGVPGCASDPVLHVVRMDTGATVAANDDWGDTADGGVAVAAACPAVGAFPLSPGAKDAALVVTLPPGVYSEVIEPRAGAPGICLAELYELQ